jgi:hypothetical protein
MPERFYSQYSNMKLVPKEQFASQFSEHGLASSFDELFQIGSTASSAALNKIARDLKKKRPKSPN